MITVRKNVVPLIVVTIRLAMPLAIAGAIVWQLAGAAADGPLSALGLVPRITCAVLALRLALLDMVAFLCRRFYAPLQQVVEYIAQQNADETSTTPPSVLSRHDALGRLSEEINHLIVKMTKQNHELEEKTLYDPLTGLGNRRLLEQRMEVVIPLSRRMVRPVSALMIDVDDFKAYNDYYGHQAGDECLIQIADVLTDTFRRDTDIIIRQGGEEFLVVLIDVGMEDSYQLAERMRGMLQLIALPHEKSSAADVVTVSIGVSTVPAGTLIGIEQLIKSADEALYICKQQGRNQSFCQPVASEEEAV